jgi:hypothetical protein
MAEPALRKGCYAIEHPQYGIMCAYRNDQGQWFLSGVQPAILLPPGWTLGPRLDDLRRDAARWRWIEQHVLAIDVPPYGFIGDKGAFIDAFIDAEIASG